MGDRRDGDGGAVTHGQQHVARPGPPRPHARCDKPRRHEGQQERHHDEVGGDGPPRNAWLQSEEDRGQGRLSRERDGHRTSRSRSHPPAQQTREHRRPQHDRGDRDDGHEEADLGRQVRRCRDHGEHGRRQRGQAASLAPERQRRRGDDRHHGGARDRRGGTHEGREDDRRARHGRCDGDSRRPRGACRTDDHEGHHREVRPRHRREVGEARGAHRGDLGVAHRARVTRQHPEHQAASLGRKGRGRLSDPRSRGGKRTARLPHRLEGRLPRDRTSVAVDEIGRDLDDVVTRDGIGLEYHGGLALSGNPGARVPHAPMGDRELDHGGLSLSQRDNPWRLDDGAAQPHLTCIDHNRGEPRDGRGPCTDEACGERGAGERGGTRRARGLFSNAPQRRQAAPALMEVPGPLRGAGDDGHQHGEGDRRNGAEPPFHAHRGGPGGGRCGHQARVMRGSHIVTSPSSRDTSAGPMPGTRSRSSRLA